MKVGKDVMNHRPRCFERAIAEEYPREAHEIECQKDGDPLAKARTLIRAIMMKDIRAKIFVHGQSHSVHSAPRHEIETRAVPQTAQKHREQEIEILTHLAFAVSAKRDINVIA